MDIDKEELKNETKDTVNQVKDTLKNVDINKEAQETKSFVKEMMVSPFETVERIAHGQEDVFKKAVVLVIIIIASSVIVALINAFKYSYGTIGGKLWDLVLAGVRPIISIVVPAIVILIMNKSNKKSLTVIISTLVVASIPAIITDIIDIVEALLPRIYFISSPVSSALSAISIVLTFFGMKTLFEESKEAFLMKFVVIRFITSLVLYII